MHATLALPTGRLIVGDPSALFGDAKPLDLALPPGEYQVSADASGLELRLADAEPERWETLASGFDAPSGHVCLLDESALTDFTDLGDEPVDEYELLTERLRAHPGEPVEFSGLVVFPLGDAARVRTLRAGCDRNGRCTRIAAEF
ncbi:MAG TPA: hypothetical protein VFA06_16950 [Actinocrinis sp.]|uniref:hypothetical protein n=1 Tax=Actinocrinis sp. TaxID=1920516 RepID=UPI002D3B00B6|nr:hypothetical protein [Actinocrinis sp.]HZU57561.1 hypothetical protein [Actinocrinis sp.]